VERLFHEIFSDGAARSQEGADNARVTELVKRSATWMAGAIRDREIGAVELFVAHAERIADRNPDINALVLPRLEPTRTGCLARVLEQALGGWLDPDESPLAAARV
jgi:Asp-tRNA(Asn)/Glu-tRNA(Gln) amidotransferase A subunit family amidase